MDENTPRILIVDDEPLNVEVLEELLEDFVVDHAYCGPEALIKIDEFAPDLVLLDVMMPGMDGYEVCRQIRNHDQFSGSIVVFLSAKAGHEDIETGYNVGANDYLTKPFDHCTLLGKIESFLESRRSQGQAH